MFSKIAIFIASVAVFVAANPVPDIKNSCNTGPVQCCNSVQSADDHGLSNVLGFLGLDLGEVTGQVGVNCNPVTLIGAAGNSCSAQPVCCENNNFNGLLVIGCSPVNINL